jgi:hypothetical protein
MYYAPVDIGKHILLFAWILCHICIHENRIIDQVAQDSSDTPISNCIIPCTNFKPFVIKSYSKRYQDSWDQQMHGKLHEICI